MAGGRAFPGRPRSVQSRRVPRDGDCSTGSSSFHGMCHRVRKLTAAQARPPSRIGSVSQPAAPEEPCLAVRLGEHGALNQLGQSGAASPSLPAVSTDPLRVVPAEALCLPLTFWAFSRHPTLTGKGRQQQCRFGES